MLEASKSFRAAIPDLKAEIEELLVVNDRAVVRYSFTGHFTGSFKDLKGDDRQISFRAVAFAISIAPWWCGIIIAERYLFRMTMREQ